ncbi:MAG: NAD(P)-dependent oxidoreductase [Lentisphaerae bacterium]|nr:NAD(P)-dependent oxidoreductase [Lentisphaerota bacterium]
MKNTSIGFIGLGVMGKSMAEHLLKAGYQLIVWARTPSKVREITDRGALPADNTAELARRCDIIITIVGFPKDVEEVYFSDNGLLANIRPGTLLIDMTTSSPSLARRIASIALKHGAQALDAPVSGGDKGAQEATLSIMVGGDQTAFDRALPVFRTMGKNIVYQGPSGSGQHCKLCNQIAIASNMIGVCEAVAYAARVGLDPKKMLTSISSGAAASWSLNNLAPRMLSGNFDPGFYVKHFIKDMTIASESIDSLKLNMPGLDLALRLYRKLAEQGYENDGTQALYRLYQ